MANPEPLPHESASTLPPTFPRFYCAAVLLGLAGLYLLTLPRAHQIGDSYQWIATIQTGNWAELFHPHHLVYTAMAYLWVKPFVAAGVAIWISAQLLSVLGGILANAAFFRILWSTTRDPRLSALGTLLYGTTFVTWMFSVEVEVYIFATAGLLWSFVALLYALSAPSPRRFLLVGCLCGLAGLFHQTTCFFLLPALIAAWHTRPASTGKTLLQLLMPILGFGLVAGVPYILVGVIFADVHTPVELFRWMTKHAQYGYYGGVDQNTPLKAAVGWTRALVYGWYAQDALWARQATVVGVLHGLAQLVCALCAAGFFFCALHRFLKHGSYYATLTPPARYALLWFAANAGFSLYYEPHNIEWWVLPMAPFLLLALWSSHTFATPRAGHLVALWLCVQCTANLAGDFLPRRAVEFDPFAAAVRTAQEQGGEDALYIIPALMAIRCDTNPLSFQIALREAHNSIPDAVQTLRERMQRTAARNAPVIIMEYPMDGKVFAYQPQARPVMKRFTAFLREQAQEVGSVRLPWKNVTEFGDFARWQPVRIYRLSPGTKTWTQFDALLQSLQTTKK